MRGSVSFVHPVTTPFDFPPLSIDLIDMALIYSLVSARKYDNTQIN
jgi:hypothetical protein